MLRWVQLGKIFNGNVSGNIMDPVVSDIWGKYMKYLSLFLLRICLPFIKYWTDLKTIPNITEPIKK